MVVELGRQGVEVKRLGTRHLRPALGLYGLRGEVKGCATNGRQQAANQSILTSERHSFHRAQESEMMLRTPKIEMKVVIPQANASPKVSPRMNVTYTSRLLPSRPRVASRTPELPQNTMLHSQSPEDVR